MPNIKPISDLRNYSEVLHDVAVGAPVFLTKNGRGRYAIVDMQDYERAQATIRRMNELAKGRHSGETEGWLNRIYYSPEARRDLDDIWDYIVSELQNRSAAERVTDRILDAVDQLKNFAEMGTPLSSIADVGTNHRFLVSGSYMVFYRVQGSNVYVDRILYGRSDYMSVLFKDLLRKETIE